MIISRVIPCLLLRNNGLVKTVKFKNSTYIGDPINAVKIFNEKEVDELIFLDIDASVEKKQPPFNLLRNIAGECFMPLCYGGGISNINQISEILKCGVEKVSINTCAVKNPEFIKEAADIFGSSTIVVAIDVRKSFLGKYQIYLNGGKINTGKDPLEFVKLVEQMGAGEVFLNSIDKDGTMMGYDLDLIKKISASVKIPVIACGGAGTVDHMHAAIQNGAAAVSAGSFFVFHGKRRAVLISYPNVNEIKFIFSK
jgi:imidazole glycerol-phosphate synthase subunit HisF